jgi:prephenate dehydratase/chorismate mutase/prephenate dehydratase
MGGAIRVGYQGEPGAFSETAVRSLFPDAAAVPHHGFRDVFQAVESGAVDFGMMPIENSQAGSINDTYDLLARGSASIVGEVIVPVHHALLALPGTSVADIHRVISHPQALAQCQNYLEELDAEVLAVHDTAGAARLIAEEHRVGEAAVAAERAGAVYGLEVLAAGIEDDPNNQTRFVAVSTAGEPLGEPDKTSLVFEVRSIPGALHRCLGPFAERDLNLSKLESRPLGGRPWEYRFYLDVEVGKDDEAFRAALEAFGEFTVAVKVLGSYPRWQEQPGRG